MAGEPGMSHHAFVTPMTSKLLNSFVTHGDKEEMVTEIIEKPVSLSTIQDAVLKLDQIRQMEEQHFKDLVFVMGFSGQDKQPILTVTQRQLNYFPPFGYTSRIHLVFKGNEFAVNVLGVMLQSGSVTSDAEVYELCKMFTDQSAFKFFLD